MVTGSVFVPKFVKVIWQRNVYGRSLLAFVVN